MANKTEKVCIHCGEKVSADVEICPNCGLNVEAVSYTNEINNSEKEMGSNINNNINAKKNNAFDMINAKALNTKSILISGLAILFIVAIIVAIVLTRKKSIILDDNTIGTVTTKENIKQKFDVDIKEPENADDLQYVVESDNVAKLAYKKIVSDGQEMNFVLRVSSSTEDIEKSIGLTDSKGEDVEFAYTPIMMTVICDDGSEITVESKVALDDTNQEMRYMRALWYDNDKYYSMVTDNLYIREDFLQEVNRVIISNHELSEDGEGIEIDTETETKLEVETETQLKTETSK